MGGRWVRASNGGQMFFLLPWGRVALGGTGAVLSSVMLGVSLILRLQASGEQGGHDDKPGAGMLAWDS